MSDTKKWIVGTFIGVFTILLTIFGFWLDGYRDDKKECDDLILEVNTKVNIAQSLINDSQSVEESSKVLSNNIKQTTRKLDRANNYFNALEAESVVANLHQIIVDAKEAVDNDFNSTFFSKPTQNGKNIGDIWYDYLKQAGFPSNPTETRKKVRILLKMGLEEGAGNQIAMGIPAMEQVIENVSEELKVLKGDIELIRFENYSEQFQGVSNIEKFIKPIQTELNTMKRKLEENKNKLRENNLKNQQLSSELNAICIRSQEKNCKIKKVSKISCE